MIVVDASLAMKWILWEADSGEALEFLNTHGRELVAPDLIYLEVASGIVRRANDNPEIGSVAVRALEKWTTAWSDHVVKNYRVTRRRLFAASSIALELRHKLPDCVYLALAQELGCELATCDSRFREKALSFFPHIKLLDKY